MFTLSIKFVALAVKSTANHTHYIFTKLINICLFCSFKTKYLWLFNTLHLQHTNANLYDNFQQQAQEKLS